MPEKPSRGRPRRFNEATATTLAMELFWSAGFSGASTFLLEKKTGLARSSMLNTFGTKRQLLDRALDEYMRTVERDLTGPLRNGTAGIDDLLWFFRQLDLMKKTSPGENGCLMLNTSIELSGDKAIYLRMEAYRDLLNHAFHGALNRAAQAKELPEYTVKQRAILLTALVVSVNLAARSLGSAAATGICSAARAEISSWKNPGP